MSNETEHTASIDASTGIEGFGEVEMDAIGEIENITMGSAATAVSNLLNAKVWITTPRVKVVKVSGLLFPDLEPSVRVQIEYIEGVSGSSIMVLKQSDVQLMLNQLMGLPLEVTEDFQFDEMNISAVCEVMNQMMGASATALSELISTKIDISTPKASVSDGNTQEPYFIGEPDDYVVQISFNLTIDGIINSEFISVLSIDLAKTMADKMLAGYGSALDETSVEAPAQTETANSGASLSQEEIEKMMSASQQPAPQSSSGGTMSQEEIERLMGGMSSQQTAPQQPIPQQQAVPVQPMQQMPVQQPVMMNQQIPPQQMYPQQPMPQYYGYQQPMPAQMPPPVNIQSVQLHNFEDYTPPPYLTNNESDNLKLLMNVPLTVTVEIGSAKKKVREILDFSQGTVIELERQAGAPVDIVVNGNLIARGDVVVIEDNFAVRVTEIIKSKFLDTLGNKE